MNRYLYQLREAIARGDRIAAITLAQRLWHAGDIRRTAVVALWDDGTAARLPDYVR